MDFFILLTLSCGSALVCLCWPLLAVESTSPVGGWAYGSSPLLVDIGIGSVLVAETFGACKNFFKG